MAETEVEKQGYGFFERLMIIFVPVLFVIVLLLVLMTLFDVDFRNKALELGNSVPVLKNVLPEPKVAGNSMDDDQIRSIKMTEKIEQLEAELTALKSELAEANAGKQNLESEVKDLQDENARLKRLSEEEQLEDEQYTAKIGELAGMFARMSPGKAAPIVQNMEPEEIVLLFSAMSPDDRVRIMEKMNPQIAAEAAMKLKDNVPAKDMQLAALQARLDKQAEGSEAASSSTLDEQQLNATFSAMDAKSAGQMLINMMAISPSKVLRILNSVDNAARSAILTEMSKLDEKAAAQIVTKMMPGS